MVYSLLQCCGVFFFVFLVKKKGKKNIHFRVCFSFFVVVVVLFCFYSHCFSYCSLLAVAISESI